MKSADMQSSNTSAIDSSSSSPLLTTKRYVAMALVFIAGYIDVVGYLTLSGVFVSFMSGNSTSSGLHLGQGNSVALAKALLPIPVFVVSVGFGSWLMRRQGLRTLLLLEIALLTAFAVISNGMMPNARSSGDSWVVLTLLAVFAMGLQNAVVRRVGKDNVGLTYVTGSLAALGVHLAGWLDRSEPQAGVHIRLLTSLWLSFLAGATFSSWLAIRFGVTLIPPLIILVVLLLMNFRRQIHLSNCDASSN
jgi:uncharacterized membrane protein YoaK (UPF0700 family)